MTLWAVVGTLVRVQVRTSSIVDEGDRQVSVLQNQQSSVLWLMHVAFAFCLAMQLLYYFNNAVHFISRNPLALPVPTKPVEENTGEFGFQLGRVDALA